MQGNLLEMIKSYFAIQLTNDSEMTLHKYLLITNKNVRKIKR